MGRRELLYAVVREAMTRAGVLSSGYKFKVLSLDNRGRQFLVMVDLARSHGGETARLAEIEALIAQAAKSRHDILVTAVYWRMNEHVAVGDLGARPKVGESPPPPTELPAATPVPVSRSRFEPIQADEVAAFKQALASGMANPGAAAAAAVGVAHGASAKSLEGSSGQSPRNYTLLTGFEDTELPDPDQRAQALSGSQYGDLR